MVRTDRFTMLVTQRLLGLISLIGSLICASSQHLLLSACFFPSHAQPPSERFSQAWTGGEFVHGFRRGSSCHTRAATVLRAADARFNPVASESKKTWSWNLLIWCAIITSLYLRGGTDGAKKVDAARLSVHRAWHDGSLRMERCHHRCGTVCSLGAGHASCRCLLLARFGNFPDEDWSCCCSGGAWQVYGLDVALLVKYEALVPESVAVKVLASQSPRYHACWFQCRSRFHGSRKQWLLPNGPRLLHGCHLEMQQQGRCHAGSRS